MSESTRIKILHAVQELFARSGYDGISMRILAKQVGIAPSVVYHYYSDKDVLLQSVFEAVGQDLGAERARLKPLKTVREQIAQRIAFQFAHDEEVVFMLKYYLHYRPEFLRLNSGYVPRTAYMHISEVLQSGIDSSQLPFMDVAKQAKIITHMINGFVLEYYPNPPKGKELRELSSTLSDFIMKAIEGRPSA